MEKPFIHLLKTINGYYFFDVNKNEVVNIDKNVYILLEDILNGRITEDYKKNERLNLLIANGFLSSKRVKTIKHPASDDLEYFLSRKVRKITLQVTQNCNLRCSYCIYSDLKNDKQRSHSNKNMSFEVAKKAVDFLLNHSIDTEEANISFYGGEPLIKFDLIKEVIEYANKIFLGKKITYNITTNGTLLTDEIAEYFTKNNVQVMISIDGPQKIHDINRRFAKDGTGSFNKIIANLNHIKEKYPDFLKLISLSMVIDPQNDYDTINSVFDYDIFKKVSIHSTIVDNTYSNNKTVYTEDYIEKRNYELFCAILDHLGLVNGLKVFHVAAEGLNYINDVNRKLQDTLELSDETAPGGPCIPGQRRLFINVNGDFFPCERVSEASDVMKIGNINDGFDYEKCFNLLNIGKLTEEKCKKCWAFNECTLCAKHADNGDELSGKLKSTYCSGVRNDFEYDLYTKILFKEAEKIYR